MTAGVEPPPPDPAEMAHGGGFAGLVRNSAVFALGSLTGKVVGLLLLPVLTRVLSPEGFGRLDVLSTLATTVTSVAVLGVDVAATRLYADRTPAEQRRLFGSWMVLAAGVLVPVLALSWAGAGAISRMLFGTGGEALGVAMVGLYAAGNLYQVIGLTALRNQGRARTYAIVSAAAFVANGVAVLALVAAEPRASAAMTGMALGVSFGGLGAVTMARRLVLNRPSAASTRALLALGLPLVPALAATWIGDFANRAILLGAAGSAEVGLLSVAIRFGSVGVLVVTGFQLAWMPRAFAQARRPGATRRIARDAERIVLAVATALVPLAVLAPELVRLVAGAAYLDAVPAIGFSLVATLGLALVTVAGMPSALDRRTRDLGLAGTAGALSAVAVNVLFASLWGATGTAAALATGQLVSLVTVAALARSSTALPLNWARMGRTAAAAVAVCLVCTLVDDLPLWSRLAAGAAFAGLLVADGSVRELARFVRSRAGAGSRDAG
ncbi:MAG: lipopolysaccharide biosynthesis protein [Acidimicrobiia bacterium]